MFPIVVYGFQGDRKKPDRVMMSADGSGMLLRDDTGREIRLPYDNLKVSLMGAEQNMWLLDNEGLGLVACLEEAPVKRYVIDQAPEDLKEKLKGLAKRQRRAGIVFNAMLIAPVLILIALTTLLLYGTLALIRQILVGG